LEITSNERDFNDFVVCMDEEERKLIDEWFESNFPILFALTTISAVLPNDMERERLWLLILFNTFVSLIWEVLRRAQTILTWCLTRLRISITWIWFFP
jgi:hypothetical protein